MKAELDKSFKKKLRKQIEKVNFEVGVLQDKEYKLPRPKVDGENQLSNYAGGPVRKTSREGSGMSIGAIFKAIQEVRGINMLLEPFETPSSEIVRFTDAFLKSVTTGRVSIKRAENLLQAVVRNPILRQEYGYNSRERADDKGFNRYLFDTGQTFKSIIARVIRVRR